MGIFSSIGKAIGKVAGGVVKIVSPVAKTAVGVVAGGLGIGGGQAPIPTTVRIQQPNFESSLRLAQERATQTVQSTLADTLAALTERLAPQKPQQQPVNAPAATGGGFKFSPTMLLAVGGIGLGLVFIGGKLK